MLPLREILDFLEHLAPLTLAADWDNVGLLLGDAASPVERIMTCLTVTPASAGEAVERGAHLIITHHPILFQGIKRLTVATSEGKTILGLARAGVAVYSAHTAFDNAPGGINDLLAERFGLQSVVPLRPVPARECKVVVFVPDADLGKVSDAMFAAGAGRIGQYSQCSFRLAGAGTFFGSEATNPTVGKKGRREEVAEWRLEVVCPEENVAAVVRSMREAHSYEEPAYDVYPLRPKSGAMGEGRLGQLPASISLAGFAQRVRQVLSCSGVQVAGDANRMIVRVAIACGAAEEYLVDAVRARADVFVTGEMHFHDYLAAEAQGIALVIPGHYASERLGVEALATRLQTQWPTLQVWASERERDPAQWV